jgi:hypothetical protein
LLAYFDKTRNRRKKLHPIFCLISERFFLAFPALKAFANLANAPASHADVLVRETREQAKRQLKSKVL